MPLSWDFLSRRFAGHEPVNLHRERLERQEPADTLPSAKRRMPGRRIASSGNKVSLCRFLFPPFPPVFFSARRNTHYVFPIFHRFPLFSSYDRTISACGYGGPVLAPTRLSTLGQSNEQIFLFDFSNAFSFSSLLLLLVIL